MNHISFEYEIYQGQYFLTVNGYPVLLYEKDLREISPFVNAQGYSGHVHLREWFRIHRPLFYKSIITECDRSGLIIEILRHLKKSRFYNDSNSQPLNLFMSRRSS